MAAGNEGVRIHSFPRSLLQMGLHSCRPLMVPKLTRPLLKVPTMGMWASELDLRAMEEGNLVWWITFSFTSRGWPGTCALLTWGTHGTRMHDRKKASLWMQCDALGNVLLGNLGSCHPCGCDVVGCVLFQQDNQSNRASVGCAGQISPIHGGPTSQLTGLKGSAANILVPDITAHLQGSSGVHVWTGQGCFGSKSGPTLF